MNESARHEESSSIGPSGAVFTQSDPPCIVCPQQAGAPVHFAAEELRRYLSHILVAELPAKPGNGTPEIHLVPSDDPGLTAEGFEVAARDGRLHMVSRSPGSLLFAVYEFLRRYGGCRFSGAGPEGEHVPARDRIRVTDLPLRMTPKIGHRACQLNWIVPVERVVARIDWMAKNGFNYLDYNVYDDALRPDRKMSFDPETGEARDHPAERFSESTFQKHLLPDIRKRGIRLGTIAHNLLNFLPPGRYFESHPEWYMMKDGRRVALPLQLCICTSNREMVKTFIQNVLQYLRTHLDVAFLSIGPMDGLGWCECDACRAMDETPDDVFQPGKSYRSPQGENRSKARRYARFVNEVARGVKPAFPDIRIGYQGYVDLNFPPRGITLEDNVDVMPTNYWRCGAHAVAPDACPINRFFYENLSNWRAAHRGEIISGDNFYMGMHAQKSLPYPVDEVILEDWMGYKKLGIGGVFPQLNDGSFEVYGLNYTALARSAWHDDVHPGEMLTEYLEGMFGAAGAALRPIFDSFHDTIRRIRKHGKDLSIYIEKPPPVIPFGVALSACLQPNAANIACFLDELGRETLERCLQKAEKAAAPGRERRQVDRFSKAVEYWRRSATYYRYFWPRLAVCIEFDRCTPADIPDLKRTLAACDRVLEYAEAFPFRGRGWMNQRDLKCWRNDRERIAKEIKALARPTPPDRG